MIVSRMVSAAVRSAGAIKRVGGLQQQQQKRLISTTVPKQGGHSWAYRSLNPAARKYEIWADCAGAFMWWWIFWHCFTDYHHIIGHYDFPDIAAWTDEELGIPPDDADDP